MTVQGIVLDQAAPARAEPKTAYLPKLDGLRGILASIVVLFHDTDAASLAVEGFFVLSGFLITILLLREHDKAGRISLKRFYIRRSLRIFPAAYGFWLFAIGLDLVRARAINWPQSIATLFYVSNYYQGLNGYPAGFFTHTWSLSVEEQFYLLYPALLIFLLRDRASLLRRILLVIAAVWVWRLAATLVLRLPEEYVYTAFDTRVDHLLIGCALAVLRERGQLDQAMKIFASRLALMLPTLGLIVLSQLGTHAYGAQFRNAVGFYVEPLLMALLIIQLLASGEHWAVRWLDSAPMRFLGTVSYPLYLYHGIGGAMVARLLQQRLGVPFLPALFLGFPASVAVASVSYFVVEKPFLRLKERLAK